MITTDASKYVGARYIGKDDLLDGPLSLSILDVSAVTFPAKGTQPAETVLVLEFEDDRRFPLSAKINIRILIKAYGRDWTNWIGKRVVIYRDDNVSFGSSLTGGNRIRIPDSQADRQRDIEEAMVTRETTAPVV